jgi:murein DD-endopeptidase MepM/ murein hydrolase activator NlpD
METKPPAAVPKDSPASFAPETEGVCHWPVRTGDPRKRIVSYFAEDSTIVGSKDRRFLALRSEGKRYHVGVDLYGNVGDPVVACTDGRIVNFYEFYAGSFALFVSHGPVVVNYAELVGDSLTRSGLHVGSAVSAGQTMGFVAQLVSDHMCHFETYAPGTEQNARWLVGQPRPKNLLNPTKFLLHLAAQGIGIDAKKAAEMNLRLGATLNWKTRLGEIAHMLRTDATPSSAGDTALALAVARWQLLHGLAEDGVVGPNTWAALERAVG